MSVTRRTLIALCLVLIASALGAVAVQAGEPAAGAANIAVKDVQFRPVAVARNVVTIQAQNLTARPQVLGVHIQTRSSSQGRGWGTQFFETLAPREEKSWPFGYSFSLPPEVTGSVRLHFYNPASTPASPQEIDITAFFQETKRSVAQIGLREETPAAATPAPPAVAKAVLAQFTRFQRAMQDRKYADAWALLTRVYRQGGFFDRCEGPYGFVSFVSLNPSPESWGRGDIVQLRPGEVRMQGEEAVLRATLGDAVWPIEFAREGRDWRIDWITGRPPLPEGRRERIARLLPLLQKRTTAHFDIYYAAGSSAARDVDKIAEQREAAYQAVNEFLGTQGDLRLLLIFFDSDDAKVAWVHHQGAGLADGTTIVEIYNSETQLDPFHETAHSLAGPLGDPPAILAEGFAVYMSERLGAPPLKSLHGGEATTYERVKQLRGENQWIPLAKLLTFSEIGSDESQPGVAYPEAGAFVKFLVDTYGKDKFVTAFRELRNSEDGSTQQQNVAALERIYGMSLKELDRAWRGAMGLTEAAAPRPTSMQPFIAPADPPAARYDIQARLDPEKKLLSGTETIHVVNTSRLTLATLALAADAGVLLDPGSEMESSWGGRSCTVAEARFADGSKERAVTDRLAPWCELTFESASPLQEVVLDPEGVLPLLATVPRVSSAIRESRALPWTGAGAKAQAVYEQAVKDEVDDAEAWLKIAFALYDGAFYPEARDVFARLSAAQDDRSRQFIGLVWQGHVLDLMDKREEALACYRQAKESGFSGAIRHDQYGMVIDPAWVEARLQTPFVRGK